MASKPHSRMLEPGIIARVCGGRADVLDRLRAVFVESVPKQMERVRLALREGNTPLLGEGAHLLHGTLSAFSTAAGGAALALEDAAQRNDPRACAELVARLDVVCSRLLDEASVLTIDDLGWNQKRS